MRDVEARRKCKYSLRCECVSCVKYIITKTKVKNISTSPSCSSRVRVNVASLVTVLQMGRMEYLTEVMRCLMLRLVANAAATKHPQLMLRRTESVVEKMLTNWMALCMYNYLKVRECVDFTF